MKFKDIAETLGTLAMVDVPEVGHNLYVSDKVIKTYGDREVSRVYIDAADNDLMIELKEVEPLRLHQFKDIIGLNILDDNSVSSWLDVPEEDCGHIVFNEGALTEYGNREVVGIHYDETIIENHISTVIVLKKERD